VTARTGPLPPPAALTKPGRPMPGGAASSAPPPRTATTPAAPPRTAATPPSQTTAGTPVPQPAVARKGPHTIPRGKAPSRPVPEPPTSNPSGMVDLGPAGAGKLVGAGDSISDLAIAEISEELVPLPPPSAGAKPTPLRGKGDSDDPLILPPKKR
jgi:hypothetical protein